MTVTDRLDYNRMLSLIELIYYPKGLRMHCERPCFTLRKAVNCKVKGGLLHAERPLFANSLAVSRLAVHKERAVQTHGLDGSNIWFQRL